MKALKTIQAGLLVLFGTISLFMTLSVIFDLFSIRKMEGNYVLFIVYTNLICSIIYLFAAFLNRKNIKLSNYGLAVALTILIVSFVGFLIFISNGGVFEIKTIKAMIFRIAFTLCMLIVGIIVLKMENKIKTSIL